MKKFFAFVSALALALSLAAVPAFAAGDTIDTATGSSSHAVKATYDDGSGSGSGGGTIVYSVNIEWGAMEFTYTAASKGQWNPDTHAYGEDTKASWTSNGSNTVKITNHSNAAVKATLSYTAATGFEEIIGSFDNATINLATAEGTTLANAPTETARLTLTGELASTTTDNTTIGTVTVTLG